MNEPHLRFDYAALEPETRVFVQERAERIHGLARSPARAIVQIGQDLTEVKARLGHGKFLEWIKKEFGWKRSSAENFMLVHENVKLPKFGNLEIDVSALYLIAAPKTPEPVRQQAIEVAMSGERVTHSAVKAVVARFNQTGDAMEATGGLFRAVAEVRQQAAALPSPAEARRKAIETGAHTLDRTGTYQPPMTAEQQADFKADMMTTHPAFEFCRWVSNGAISPQGAAQIVTRRQWTQYYRDIDAAITWLEGFKEVLRRDGTSVAQ